MKVKRHKKFQRSLSFFRKNFGFEAPYKILIDGTLANAALVGKVNMREQFPKFFEGLCKLVTTPCVLIETEKLGPTLYGAVQVLKGLQMSKCQHLDKPVPASECLKSIARSKKRKRTKSLLEDGESNDDNVVVATQDANLRSYFRGIIGVPLLYLYGSAPTLEKPSEANTKWVEKRDKKKLEATDYQKKILQHIKEDVLPSTEGPSKKGTKKRKRAGPNPLSCKKAKKLKDGSTHLDQGTCSEQSDQVPKKKRKRIKVRIPKHVKEVRNNDNTL